MHLVAILLPLCDNRGAPFPREVFEAVHHDLTERFGGVTAFLQSPAIGLWKDGPGAAPERDRVVLVEVLVEELDRDWWRSYREGLERTFRQDEILLRATGVERL